MEYTPKGGYMNRGQCEEYIRILQEIYPDRGGSAVRKQRLPGNTDPAYALDIIVPAYNVEKYIDECLLSILGQETDFHYRLIVTDDGSTDGTGTAIEKYRDRENVTIVHQKNGGLSAARNAGLELSTSDYVMFVDSDDRLPPDAVRKLAAAAQAGEEDIVAGSYCNFRKFRWLKKIYRQRPGVIVRDSELKGHAWGKVFRRSLFENIQFPERYWFEDSVMHQIIYPLAKRKSGTGDIVYERRINKNSITQSGAGNPKSLDSLWVTLRLMEDRKLLGMAFTQEYYEYLLNQTVLTHQRLAGLGNEVREKAFYVMCCRIDESIRKAGFDRKSGSPVEEAVRKGDFEAFSACAVSTQMESPPL